MPRFSAQLDLRAGQDPVPGICQDSGAE